MTHTRGIRQPKASPSIPAPAQMIKAPGPVMQWWLEKTGLDDDIVF